MDQLAEIKKRIDIVEFINRHVPLQKAGRNFKGLCPFHSEKTPSFVVSPDRQIWHCFGACNEGGDIFKFLMKWENLTFGEALKILAQQAGVKLDRGVYTDQDWDKKQRLLTINQYATDFYQFLLEKHKLGERGRKYIEDRGVNLKTAKHFYLGYAPRSWSALLNFLRKKGYGEAEILSAGLISKSQNNRFYDRFRARLMFPLMDMRGNILGFSGRVMDTSTKGGKEMKYVNTPETSIYHKRENLFGLAQAHKEIRDKNEIILVEGEFDAILAHQYGYRQTAAIKGSALTRDHLRLIKRLTNRLVFALDMDEAGQKAIKSSIEEAEKYDLQMHVVNLKSGKDPADIFKNQPNKFTEFYKNKQTIYEYLMDFYSKGQDLQTVYGQKTVIEKMLPSLANIYNPILFDYYLKLLCKKTSTEVETIKKAIFNFRNKAKQKQKYEKEFKTVNKKNAEEALENYLLAILVQSKEQETLVKMVEKTLEKADFYSPAVFKLFELVKKIIAQKQNKVIETLEKNLPSELTDAFNRGFLYELTRNEIDYKKEIKRVVLKIKKHSLKKQLKNLASLDKQEDLKNKLKTLREVEKSLSVI